MFPDAAYYVTLMHGSSPMACIVRGMDTVEFYYEFRDRFNRMPYILSLVPLDSDEFDSFLDIFEGNNNTDCIFDNGDQSDN